MDSHNEDAGTILKRISAQWPVVVTTRDWTYSNSPQSAELRSCIAPDFQATLDGYPGIHNLDRLHELFKQDVSEYPEAYLYAREVTAYVDEQKGLATVYLDMDMVLWKDVTTKAMTELTWKRGKSGKWMIHGFLGMRGMTADG